MMKSDNTKQSYKTQLKELQVQLVRLQRHIIKNDLRLLIIFEGRDAAGKDGVIKRITEHLSPRETRVVALGKPSERDTNSWYFQRYTDYLPSRQEMVLMNRSWYNRGGVEKVMGFCTEAEYDQFLKTVVPFEKMLSDDGIQIIKYYLDISKTEQQRRLEDRRVNPLKQWKISPIDDTALQHWDDYSTARNDMLQHSHSEHAPWYIVRADNKKRTRLNVVRHLLSIIDCPDKDQHLTKTDTKIVFPFRKQQLEKRKIHK
ncbi:MAG: polyphosphate kinase 2 [Gammaproteobacteria bacterium]|nr:polyphosphate kinase 2 [Gammaproteobacteria bacterium]